MLLQFTTDHLFKIKIVVQHQCNKYTAVHLDRMLGCFIHELNLCNRKARIFEMHEI